ncbi:TetR/AcrR family transcriptional regulator [Neptuniibacter caesariensis]|uniref:Transcriptional regulator, TetR family protein n=1 Tax=Neptuniibacter caesariensis TaxID=207954 RepID=A0A7U8C6G2_NEPCE|nr:TetR/AcrR family transcriptional regulator [Neptuniibacter caesariensis]EAR62448.1 transcriptional regulator, TetR family protein [Oceanospirillum sp. MED92] [Neptuniibacter caesariensis]
MANVAKYDRDEVIHKAMMLFWEKGFNATSTRDLQDAVNLRPGSFYAAFGSKEALFSEALKLYASESHDYLLNMSAENDSAMGVIRAFMQGIILGRKKVAPSEMCMLVKTIAELTDEHSVLLEQSRELLKNTERQLAQLLEKAQQEGEFSKHKSCSHTASYLMVQIMGLRTYMRNSQSPKLIESLLDEMFSNLQH